MTWLNWLCLDFGIAGVCVQIPLGLKNCESGEEHEF